MQERNLDELELASPRTYLTKQEAADRLGVSLVTVDRLIRNDKLTKFTRTMDRSVRFDEAEVVALAEWVPDGA